MKGDEKGKGWEKSAGQPTGIYFIKGGIVVIWDGAKLNHLTRNNINKEKTF